ncbi:phosphotransferase enzyme family-domain-containing protein [Lipomyces orientalis]|uniref:Phosphotransferase enzyme family-domain-containing protein n=1 Tax=Lipomyces orientalis TaxID=1233043 RepID=A0ACC3TGE2_9ASCO
MATVRNTQSSDFSGLEWVRDLWGSEPRWTVDLDEEAIKQTVQSTLELPGACTIEFLAQGAFNRLYIIRSTEKDIVARVTLPVDPAWKTLSEVATLKWVRENTSLPVPEVLAYRADRSSVVGFEWILMSKMPGKPLADVWRDVSFSAKENLVRQLALFCSDTFQKQLRGIGNLFPDSTTPTSTSFQAEGTVDTTEREKFRKPLLTSLGQTTSEIQGSDPASEDLDIRDPVGKISTSEESRESKDNVFSKKIVLGQEKTATRHDAAEDIPEVKKTSHAKSATTAQYPSLVCVQRIVSAAFIWDDHIHQGVSRGPFSSSKDWLSARLALAENDYCKRQCRVQKRANSNEDSEEEEDDPEELENINYIISKLRSRLDEFFPTIDLEPEPSMIYHDDMSRHNILVNEDGILTAVVDWECVSALPLWIACQFPPILQGKPLDREPIKSKYQHDENGEVAELYWEHLENYELTQLRHLFLEEMQRLQPTWVEIFESSQQQRDFDFAVTNCDDSFLVRRIRNWLNDMDSGVENFRGLEERIDNASL